MELHAACAARGHLGEVVDQLGGSEHPGVDGNEGRDAVVVGDGGDEPPVERDQAVAERQ